MNTATGPRTTDGKAISSRNAETHGLTSARFLLKNEDEARFNQELNSNLEHYGPLDETEWRLIEDLTQAHWRFQRAIAAEAAFLSLATSIILKDDPKLTEEEALGTIFLNKDYAKKFALVQRYLTSARNTLNRLENAAILLRKRNEKLASAQVSFVTPAAKQTRPAPPQEFVSQSGTVPAEPVGSPAPSNGRAA